MKHSVLIACAAILLTGCDGAEADVAACEAFVTRDGAADYRRLSVLRSDSAPMTLAAFRNAAGLPVPADEVSRLKATRLELAARRGELQLRQLTLRYQRGGGVPREQVCAFRLVGGALPDPAELAAAGDTSLADGRTTLARLRGESPQAGPKFDCCL